MFPPCRLWRQRDQPRLHLDGEQDLSGRQDGAGADPDGEDAGEVSPHDELLGGDAAEVAVGGPALCRGGAPLSGAHYLLLGGRRRRLWPVCARESGICVVKVNFCGNTFDDALH